MENHTPENHTENFEKITSAPRPEESDDRTPAQYHWQPEASDIGQSSFKSGAFIVLSVVLVLIVAGLLGIMLISSKSARIRSTSQNAASEYQKKVEAGEQEYARNTERRTDLNALQAQFETFYGKSKYYPSFAQVNDLSFRTTHFSNIDSASFQDPGGNNDLLSGQLTTDKYAYIVFPNGCDNTSIKCTRYNLQAMLEGAEPYTKSSLN